MKINHIGIWVDDLEKMKLFYLNWFNGNANSKYINTKKGFESYFITFQDSSKLELMKMINHNNKISNVNSLGFAHVAFSVGSKKNVDNLTRKMKSDGVKIVGEPRITGDGFYESKILDPEDNEIEIIE